MKVILLENVIGLGIAGDIKNVRGGYARNFLIPNRFAELATMKKEHEIKVMQEALAKKAKLALDSANQAKSAIEEVKLVIRKKVGEEGKLFGSVTNADISDALKEKGYDVDKHKVVVDHIKTIGDYPVKLRLDEGVVAELTLSVVDENVAAGEAAVAPAPEPAPAPAPEPEAEAEAEAAAPAAEETAPVEEETGETAEESL